MRSTFVATMATLFGLTLIIQVPSTTWAKAAHGVFMVVKGDIKVKLARNGRTRKARPSMKVGPKDTILAGTNGRAKIVMVDKNVINISPNTKLLLEEYQFEPEKNKKNVVLNVLYGKVRSTVKQKYDDEKNKFRVKTPSAVAGVRGTDFLASYNQQTRVSEVVTFEGVVEVGQLTPQGSIGNAVRVGQGQMTRAAAGAAPSTPVKVEGQQLQQLNMQSDADKSSANESEANGPSQEAPANKEKKGSRNAPGDKTAKGERRAPNREPASIPPDSQQERDPNLMVDDRDLGQVADGSDLPQFDDPLAVESPPDFNSDIEQAPLDPIACDFCNDSVVNSGRSRVRIIWETQ